MVGICRPKKLKLYSWAAGHAFGRSEGILMLHILLIWCHVHQNMQPFFTEGFEMIKLYGLPEDFFRKNEKPIFHTLTFFFLLMLGQTDRQG